MLFTVRVIKRMADDAKAAGGTIKRFKGIRNISGRN